LVSRQVPKADSLAQTLCQLGADRTRLGHALETLAHSRGRLDIRLLGDPVQRDFHTKLHGTCQVERNDILSIQILGQVFSSAEAGQRVSRRRMQRRNDSSFWSISS
jgi:hypothetical protein